MKIRLAGFFLSWMIVGCVSRHVRDPLTRSSVNENLADTSDVTVYLQDGSQIVESRLSMHDCDHVRIDSAVYSNVVTLGSIKTITGKEGSKTLDYAIAGATPGFFVAGLGIAIDGLTLGALSYGLSLAIVGGGLALTGAVVGGLIGSTTGSTSVELYEAPTINSNCKP